MPTDVLILVATAILALVAVIAAVITVRAARRVASAARHLPAESVERVDATEPPTLSLVPYEPPAAPEPRVIEGRVIVVPTQQQVVATALSRPGVRLSVLIHGVTHALRPESRDRITGMMRREFRRRRRERQRAARRAAHQPLPPTPPADSWLGHEPRESAR